MSVEEIRTNLKYYIGMPVLDQAHDDIEFLLKEVERLKSALTKIDDIYDFDGNAAYAMQQIAEKALKEPTPD